MKRSLESKSLTLFLAAVLLVMTALSACSFRRLTINEPLTQEDVAFVKPGQTTMDEVVERLGAPDELTGTKRLTVFRYVFVNAKSFSISPGWIARFWLPVSPPMTFGRTATGTSAFQVTFDQEWVVQSVAFSDAAKHTAFNPSPF